MKHAVPLFLLSVLITLNAQITDMTSVPSTADTLNASVGTDMDSPVIDTSYYDRYWKAVKVKGLATYVRYDFDFRDPYYPNKTRTYYMNGKLAAEGIPVFHDRYNDSLSKWKGELIRYYENGKQAQQCNYDDNGLLHGELKIWEENGTLLTEATYEHGVLHGRSVEFSEDNPDICYITEYENGEPKNGESLLFSRSGKSVKVDFHSKKLITRPPTPNDCHYLVRDGIFSWIYDLNGIYVSLSFAEAVQYGKYYQCFMTFTNNSGATIELNPNHITGKYFKNGNSREFELMPADEYLKKITRTQVFSQVVSGLASGLSTYNAGYSTSTTSMTAVGTGGWAVGTATTTTYNPFERQAILNQEQEKLKTQAKQDKMVKDAIDGSILKRTMVAPGETIVKSFYVKYLSTDFLRVNLRISDQTYTFNMSKTGDPEMVEPPVEKPVYPQIRPGVAVGIGTDSHLSLKAGVTGELIYKPWLSVEAALYYHRQTVPIDNEKNPTCTYQSALIPLTVVFKVSDCKLIRVYCGGGYMNRIVGKAEDPHFYVGKGLRRYIPGYTVNGGIEIYNIRVGVSYFSDLIPYSIFNEKLSSLQLNLGVRIGGSNAYIR